MLEVHIPQILRVLNKGMLLLGIKGDKIPEQMEMQLIVAELRSHYSGLTIAELDLAFTLAARDVLDYNAETYQSFSVFYLNKMLHSYFRWATLKKCVEKVEYPQLPKTEVQEEDIIEMALDSFKKFKKWDSIFNALGVFKILEKRGLIDLSESGINEMVLLAESGIKQNAASVEYEDRVEILSQLEDESAMELACRRMAVAQYFNKIMRDERNKG